MTQKEVKKETMSKRKKTVALKIIALVDVLFYN